MTPSATAIAGRSTKAMWAQDEASRALGMKLEAVGPGHAIPSMKITSQLVKSHGSRRHGFIVRLADSAFALACNSLWPAIPMGSATVAQPCCVGFKAPERHGRGLVAQARTHHRTNRVQEVAMRTDAGLRGHSRFIAASPR
jgi:acyl-CoA thioesterase